MTWRQILLLCTAWVWHRHPHVCLMPQNAGFSACGLGEGVCTWVCVHACPLTLAIIQLRADLFLAVVIPQHWARLVFGSHLLWECHLKLPLDLHALSLLSG